MSFTMQTPQRALPGSFAATPSTSVFHARQPSAPLPAPASTAPELSTMERAAKTINTTLEHERQGYPDLDSQIGQGFSSDYNMQATGSMGGPFQKTKLYPIPDRIFEQYNRAQVSTMMGLFADFNHAWVTIDNALYLWDYTNPDPQLIGFEDQPHNITAIRLVKPRAGVFMPAVARVIVIATVSEIFLLGLSTEKTVTGEYRLGLYRTDMSTSIRGLDITVIEGDNKSGRIFFSGSVDNDVYELHYQQEEKWFWSRVWKINHTSSRIGLLRPSLDIFNFTSTAQLERVDKMVMDTSRDLLYTLSNKSTIRVFHLKSGGTLELAITRTLSQTLSNIGHMVQSELIPSKSRIVSIQAIPSQESARLHLLATTSTGCRFFMSATSSYGYYSSSSSAPTSMQVHHVKFPPPERPQDARVSDAPGALAAQTSVQVNSKALMTTTLAARFAPGYFFCYVERPGAVKTEDELFICTPDSGRIARSSNPSQPIRYVEDAAQIGISGAVQDIGLVTPPFAATSSPQGFGNELAVQFDKPAGEVAILTNSGVYVMRRQRMVDGFATALRPRGSGEGVEESIRNHIRLFGRGETASSALAVACGQAQDVTSDNRLASISDPDILERARTVFIEYGGRPSLNENTFIDQSVPSIDLARPSPRHDGLALYISRLVRSMWKASVVSSTTSPAKGLEILSTIGQGKLQDVQEDLSRLKEFLNTNRSFIDGLSGPEALGRAATRSDEISLQAEHRALHALVSLISNMIEGISFIQVLFGENILDIFQSLEPEAKEQFMKLTYEELFCSAQGRTLAKELVRAIVNRNIANGANVDTVADSLRRRCGSFCSPADVLIFKAQEHLKRAQEAGWSTELGRNLLNESLRLFSQVVDSLSHAQLEFAIDQYTSLQFYAGAIELALKVAQEKDRGNRALTWIQEGRPENDPSARVFEERKKCYDLIHKVVAALDKLPAENSRDRSTEAKFKAEAQAVIDTSEDEVFQTDLYDWYLAQNLSDRLLDIQSPYVPTYLLRRSSESIAIADLLWKWYSQNARAYEAARVQLDLAKSDFSLPLERRIEYLSRAKANASTYISGPGRGIRQKLLREISEYLDTASIQDDILEKLKDDPRLTGDRRKEILADVDAQVKSLDEVCVTRASPTIDLTPYSYLSSTPIMPGIMTYAS